MKLTDLGFCKGIIAEVILSTYSDKKQPNAAPMGVAMQDEQHLTVDLFNSSQTYRNIKANRCAVINLTADIWVFYKCAFKEANPLGKLPAEWFQKARSVNAPRLRAADASIEVSVEELVELTADKTRAVFKVESIKASQQYPQVFSRAMSQTIEAIIHATRVKALANTEGQQRHIDKLLEKISYCHEVVWRVAPNSPYSLVMDDLVRRLDGWRKKL